MIQLLNIFILPFNSLPSLTLITHFFTLISGEKQIQYIEWKKLTGEWEVELLHVLFLYT